MWQSATNLFRVLVVALILICIGGCDRPSEQRAEFYVFGTIVEVVIAGATQDKAERAFTDIQQQLQAMHRNWHAWEHGQLTELNQAFAEGRSISADEDLIELVRISASAERLSDGLFNPALGSLVALWGFHTSEYPVLGPPPDRNEIEQLLHLQPSAADITINGDLLSSSNPAVQLDLGGIAKGFAVDLVCRYLQEQGLNNAMVNAGGDLKAIGSKGNSRWRVGVQIPQDRIIGTVDLDGTEAVFTSGNYQRFREDAGKRYAHILDPTTGWPVTEVASATVIASEGWLADAAATALVIAGSAKWATVAKAFELDEVLITDENGVIYASEAMLDRLKLAPGFTPQEIRKL
jgi:thiamine biosynthesis lipoprotein